MGVTGLGLFSPIQQSPIGESPPSGPSVSSNPSAHGAFAGPLGGLAGRNNLRRSPPEVLRDIANHASPADRIALAQADPRSVYPWITHEVRAATITTIDAPRVRTLVGFNALRTRIQGLPTPSLREEPIAALGANIPRLPAHEQQAAIDGFLADEKNHARPRSNFLEVVVHGATIGPNGLAIGLQAWSDNPELAVAYGPARKAVLSAMQPGGSGELWHQVADRMAITNPVFRSSLEVAVVDGPAREAALLAMQPGGSGELWHQVADRMAVISPVFRDALEVAVADGPAREAALLAMQPGGSGELWHQVADRMAVTSPVFRAALEVAVADGPARETILSAMQPNGSGELWHQVADRMAVTSPVIRDYLLRVRLGD